MDTSKKERLARLSELNKRALGVSSFEAPEAGLVVGRRVEANRDLLLAIREKKGYICRAVAGRNRNWCGTGVDFICPYPKVQEVSLSGPYPISVNP